MMKSQNMAVLALQRKVLVQNLSLHSWAEADETHSKSLTNSREECNEYDLIALPCF
jgi:hypothetical protein